MDAFCIKDKRSFWLGLGLILVLVLLVFGQSLGFDYVNYDDDRYIKNNPNLHLWTSFSAIPWAFKEVSTGDWQPLVWLSWVLDYQVGGTEPWIYHTTNLVLHIFNLILLFAILRKLGARSWWACFFSLLYGLHPARVESVVWIAERKDVLSGFFFFFTCLFYVNYAQLRKNRFYFLALFSFTLGLLSKPMLVTTPVLLLCLDYWPLNQFYKDGNFDKKKIVHCLINKLPFLVLSAISIYLAANALSSLVYYAHHGSPSLDLRIQRSIVGYMMYIKSFFWPLNLSFFYPLQASIPKGLLIASLGSMVSISIGAVILMKKAPWFLAGWTWFLVSLSPVIGIIHIGDEAWADRYSYLSHLGIFMILSGMVCLLIKRYSNLSRVLQAALFAMILGLSLLAGDYVAKWKDAKTLYSHGIRVSDENYRALNNLAGEYMKEGRFLEAIPYLEQTVEVRPNFDKGNRNLGIAYFRTGRFDEAIEKLAKAQSLKPNDPLTHVTLGDIYIQQGKNDLAKKHYEISLTFRKDDAKVYYSLGNLYREQDPEKAIKHYKASLELQPEYVKARNNLANMYVQVGMNDLAIVEYDHVLKQDPHHQNALKMIEVLRKHAV